MKFEEFSKEQKQLVAEALAFTLSECCIDVPEPVKRSKKNLEILENLHREYDVTISNAVSFPKYGKDIELTEEEKQEYQLVEKLTEWFPDIKRF